jgi:ATP-dependent DNA ligase
VRIIVPPPGGKTAPCQRQPIWTPARRPSHYLGMSLYPPGFIEPCLPTVSRSLPTGPEWAFEIKHDGFRFNCRRDGERVRA